jgi:hypothetical protein
MEGNIPERDDREKITEELYRRFSRRGAWRLRVRRFVRGFTWVFIVHLISGGKRFLDFTVSLLLLLIVWPILVLAYLTPGTTLKRTPMVRL